MACGMPPIGCGFHKGTAPALGLTDFPFAIVGFDLDGTLVDTNKDLHPAINHTLARVGRAPIPEDQVAHLVGGGSRVMLERAFNVTGGAVGVAEFEDLFNGLLDDYAAHIADNSRPYPGCLEALDTLAARGCKLAVATNKFERLAVSLLDQLGMSDRFASVIGGDTLGPGRGKPAPDMIHETIARCGGDTRFAMIGDSSYDVRAAKAAGKPCVMLSFGYNDAPADTLGANAVIDHYDDLVPTLERLAR
jgi:phosphoglycolate phosphatase